MMILDIEYLMTYKEIIDRPDSDEWLRAIKFEIQFMYDKQVWNLIEPPQGVRPIENKWIFKRKINIDDNMTMYKA
jgi:hypothetical protein